LEVATDHTMSAKGDWQSFMIQSGPEHASAVRSQRLRRILARFGRQILQRFRIAVYWLLSDSHVSGGPILHQPLQTVGAGTVEFAANVRIGVYPSPAAFSTYAYIEARNQLAVVSIGKDTWINNGFVAIAEHTSIRIGERVLIGHNVEIYDSDFHGIGVSDRQRSLPEWAAPVVIEADVFISSHVRVLKGVRICRGSVVASGSVVVKDVPPNVVVGGVPAHILRRIESGE